VTLSSSLTNWVNAHCLAGAAAFDADPDHDGVAKGLEFVLGGEPNPANLGSNSIGLLPTLSASAANFVLSFHCKRISKASVSLTCQWSTDLIFLSPSSDIPIGATSSFTNGLNVSIPENIPDTLTDAIDIAVPSAKAAGGKVFIRLKATAP
jgi:hypothetical protein